MTSQINVYYKTNVKYLCKNFVQKEQLNCLIKRLYAISLSIWKSYLDSIDERSLDMWWTKFFSFLNIMKEYFISCQIYTYIIDSDLVPRFLL